MAKSPLYAGLGSSDGDEATGNGAGNFESDRSVVSIGDVYLRSVSENHPKRPAAKPSLRVLIAFGRVGQTLIDLVQPSQIKIACMAKTASPEEAGVSRDFMATTQSLAPRRTDHLTRK